MSIEEARYKAKKAQDMSELSSNDDDKNTRKVRKKVYYTSDNNDENDQLQIKTDSAPTLQDFEGIINIFKLYFICHY